MEHPAQAFDHGSDAASLNGALNLQDHCNAIISLAEAIDNVVDRTAIGRDAEEHILQYLKFIRGSAAEARETAEKLELLARTRR